MMMIYELLTHLDDAHSDCLIDQISITMQRFIQVILMLMLTDVKMIFSLLSYLFKVSEGLQSLCRLK